MSCADLLWEGGGVGWRGLPHVRDGILIASLRRVNHGFWSQGVKGVKESMPLFLADGLV